MKQIFKIWSLILLLGAIFVGCKPSYETCVSLYGDTKKYDTTVHYSYDTTITVSTDEVKIQYKDSVRITDSVICVDNKVVNLPKKTKKSSGGVEGSVEIKDGKLTADCKTDSLMLEIQRRDQTIRIMGQEIITIKETQTIKDTRNWWQKQSFGGKFLFISIPILLILLMIYLIVRKMKQPKQLA